jgi:hypothetical protein
VSIFICVERFVAIQISVGTAGGFGSLTDEALGVDTIGGVENGLALFEDERGLIVVDHGRGEQAQPRLAVFFVVPVEKSLRKSPAILNAAEAIRKPRSI